MKITLYFNDVVETINKFLLSAKREIELQFEGGFFMKLKKHTQNGSNFLEIHTSGYDETLPMEKAIEWVKWELYDCKANGIIG